MGVGALSAVEMRAWYLGLAVDSKEAMNVPRMESEL